MMTHWLNKNKILALEKNGKQDYWYLWGGGCKTFIVEEK